MCMIYSNCYTDPMEYFGVACVVICKQGAMSYAVGPGPRCVRLVWSLAANEVPIAWGGPWRVILPNAYLGPGVLTDGCNGSRWPSEKAGALSNDTS